MGLDETLTKNILIFGSNSNLQILNEERERRRIGVMVTLMMLAVTGLCGEGASGAQPADGSLLLHNLHDGKIVEHWDVMQWVPEDSEVKNRNTLF